MHADPRKEYLRPARQPARRRLPALLLTLVIAAAILLGLRFGGYFLTASEPLPQHAEVAVVLQGSFAGERVRVAGAMQLLSQGVVDHVLVSVPQHTYWGRSAPDEARQFFDERYGHELASRVDFCVMGKDVNSTEDEALAFRPCLANRNFRSVIVVTSDYHTRRAGWIWRRTVANGQASVHVWVHGVTDPEFDADAWWRRRLYAKTWLLEFSKLLWTAIFG